VSFDSKVLEFRNLFEEIMRRRPIIENRTFKDEFLIVDFKNFNKCNFINCTLMFEFGICSMSNCDFTGCKFEAKTGSPAHLILGFDKALRDAAFKDRNR